MQIISYNNELEFILAFHWARAVRYYRCTDDVIRWRDLFNRRLFNLVLLYKANKFHFLCFRTVIDHRRRHLVGKQKVTALDFDSCRTFLFFARHDVICDQLQYTYFLSNLLCFNFLTKPHVE